MRKTFAVVVVADGHTVEIDVTGTTRIGSTHVELEGLPSIQLIMDASEESRQLLKDCLIHVVEHL